MDLIENKLTPLMKMYAKIWNEKKCKKEDKQVKDLIKKIDACKELKPFHTLLSLSLTGHLSGITMPTEMKLGKCLYDRLERYNNWITRAKRGGGCNVKVVVKKEETERDTLNFIITLLDKYKVI